MGIFSSEYVTQVGTSVSRAIEDRAFISSIKSGSIKAIFEKGDFTDYILEDMTNGIGMRAERMYTYAEKHYTYGLPSGKSYTASHGVAEVQALLNAIEGSDVVIEYSHFGPPNNLHIGWMNLVANHGYHPDTNILGNLTASRGKPTYLFDMVVVVPEAAIPTYRAGALAQWGPSAASGIAPSRPGYANGAGVFIPHSPVYADPNPATTEDFLAVVYDYELNIFGEPGSETPVYFTIPVTGYDDFADYFHVRYTVGEGSNSTTKFFMYKAGSGTYPLLDNVFNDITEVFGTFFPFGYFRYNKVSTIGDKTTQEYKTSKKMLKYLGVNYDKVAAAVDANPDIEDVEQAMMIMAVPATTSHPLEQHYLFDFFNRLYATTGNQSSNVVQADIRHMQANRPDRETTIVIQDARFKLSLVNSGILKKRHVGSIGPIGSHSSGTSTVMRERAFMNYSSMGDSNESGAYTAMVPIVTHWYRRQVSKTLYDEIIVNDLQLRYHIYEGFMAVGDENDLILLVPLDHSITTTYSPSDREELYSRSLHYVFNSRVVTEVKWYQSLFFQFIVLAAAVFLTVASYGESWELVVAALAAGTITMEMVIWIVMSVLEFIVIGQLVKLFVKAIGIEAALVIAIIAAMYGMGLILENGGQIAGAPWAKELLQLSTGLTKAGNTVLQDKMEDLMGEARDFQQMALEQTAALKTANELLEENSTLSPFILFGESPESFFNRTIHTGNIGTKGYDAVSSYVEIALTLPTLQNSGQQRFLGQ